MTTTKESLPRDCNASTGTFILEYSWSRCARRCIAPCFRNARGNLEGLPEDGLDDVNICRAWKKALPELPEHKLSHVYLALFPDDQDKLFPRRHTALADTKMLVRVFNLFVELWQKYRQEDSTLDAQNE